MSPEVAKELFHDMERVLAGAVHKLTEIRDELRTLEAASADPSKIEKLQKYIEDLDSNITEINEFIDERRQDGQELPF